MLGVHRSLGRARISITLPLASMVLCAHLIRDPVTRTQSPYSKTFFKRTRMNTNDRPGFQPLVYVFSGLKFCYGLNVCVPSKFTCWSPKRPSLALFGEGASKEVIKFNWGHKGRLGSDKISALIRRDTRELLLSLSLSPCTSMKATWGQSNKMAAYKPGIRLLPETELGQDPFPWTF